MTSEPKLSAVGAHIKDELVRGLHQLDRRGKAWFALRCVEYLPESVPCRADVMDALRGFASGGVQPQETIEGLLENLNKEQIRENFNAQNWHALYALYYAVKCAFSNENSLDNNPLAYALHCHDRVMVCFKPSEGKRFKFKMKVYLKELVELDCVLETLISGG